MVPKPKPSLLEVILVHMSRDEFKLCFAIDFLEDGAEEFEGLFQLRQFSTPGWEQSDAWVEHLRRVMRFLALEHGYEFEFLELFENGSIRRRGDWIEPRNALYAMGLLTNQVNYLDALRCAARMVAKEPALAKLPVTAFREAISFVEEALKSRHNMVDLDRHQLWSAEMDDVLTSIGVERKERRAN